MSEIERLTPERETKLRRKLEAGIPVWSHETKRVLDELDAVRARVEVMGDALAIACRNGGFHELADHFIWCARLEAGEPVMVRLICAVTGHGPYTTTHAATPGLYEPSINPQGAVSITCRNGSQLGLHPREFEWVEAMEDVDAEV